MPPGRSQVRFQAQLTQKGTIMTNSAQQDDGWRRSWFRKAMWGGAAFLLLLPAVAMRFTGEVNWTGFDFVFAAVLLFGSAGLVELAMRASSSLAYRAGAVIAVGTSFLTIWVNAAVGMIGSEDNRYNLWFLGVVALALIGALVVRFRARGMALAMALSGIAQAVLGAGGMATDLRGGVLFRFLWRSMAPVGRFVPQGGTGLAARSRRLIAQEQGIFAFSPDKQASRSLR